MKRKSHILSNIIKNDDAINVASNLGEFAVDSILNDGALKDIPILSTILGVKKAAESVRDALFIKKLVSFLSETSDVDSEERNKVIDEIDSSEDYSLKVGEKLIYIIDQCEDHAKSKLIAKFFNAFLRGEISYSEFLKASHSIVNIYIEDILTFAKDNTTKYSFDEHPNYLGSGLVDIFYEQVIVSDNQDWKSGERYSVDGGAMIIVSSVGDIVRKVLAKKSS